VLVSLLLVSCNGISWQHRKRYGKIKKTDACSLCGYCCGVVFVSSAGASISSMGFGGGVVAIVQPIHAPIASTATKAMSTGMAISQNCTSALAPRFSHGWMNTGYRNKAVT
jgi:hypothetical protein